MALRAVIYIPALVETARWLPLALLHCERQGYDVVALISSGFGAWSSVWEMLNSGEADVCVVGRYEHMPPDRMPRIEEAWDTGPGPPGTRRPKVVRHT
jgi:acetyl-CoA acetyltransferase